MPSELEPPFGKTSNSYWFLLDNPVRTNKVQSNLQAVSHFHPPHLHQTDELGVVTAAPAIVVVGYFLWFHLVSLFLVVSQFLNLDS